jgi:hypothetical protein
MKVALCLSGQSRTFRQCLTSQRLQIINKLKADVFIHSWSFKGDSRLFSSHDHRFKINDYKKYINHDRNIIPATKLLQAYNPKKILIEYPDADYFISQVKKSGRYVAHGFNKLFDSEDKYKWFNCLMMYYGIYMSNKLKKDYEKERNFVYDMVIRCRMDLFFSYASFDETLEDVKNNIIYLAPNENIDIIFNKGMKEQLVKQGAKFMPNDQFAYGNSGAMDYYSSVYDYFMKDIDCYAHHGEGALTDHLWNKNTSIYQIIKTNPKIKMKIQR